MEGVEDEEVGVLDGCLHRFGLVPSSIWKDCKFVILEYLKGNCVFSTKGIIVNQHF